MTEARWIAGVDPGLSGAVAIVNELGELVSIEDTPTVAVTRGREYVAARMAELLTRTIPSSDRRLALVVIEVQQSFPGQGVRSTFRTGEGYGLWQGIAAALEIPTLLVRPVEWKRAAGIPAKSSKSESRVVATQRWPTWSSYFARVKDDGRADAALIARYGARELTFP